MASWWNKWKYDQENEQRVRDKLATLGTPCVIERNKIDNTKINQNLNFKDDIIESIKNGDENQMQKLLYHASQNGIAAFALYVDNGYNGLNFNRPAFSLMQQDMSDGRISKIVATSLDRISRNSLDVLAFADYAVSTGISLETINGDHATLDWNRQLYAALAAKGGECK